jgi:hypothetical protein
VVGVAGGPPTLLEPEPLDLCELLIVSDPERWVGAVGAEVASYLSRAADPCTVWPGEVDRGTERATNKI